MGMWGYDGGPDFFRITGSHGFFAFAGVVQVHGCSTRQRFPLDFAVDIPPYACYLYSRDEFG